jgi:hypothetical protein
VKLGLKAGLNCDLVMNESMNDKWKITEIKWFRRSIRIMSKRGIMKVKGLRSL